MASKPWRRTSTVQGGGKGTVIVVARFRPQNKVEEQEGGFECIELGQEGKSVKIGLPGALKNTFNFDRVFQPFESQQNCYTYTAEPLVNTVLEGINCTIFAYGQTGSGKTYTMTGDIEDMESKGIVPRMAEAIFDGIINTDSDLTYTVAVQFIEIYMEKIKDLFDPGKKQACRIREGRKTGVFIEHCSKAFVGSVEEVLDLMNIGALNRAVSSTRMNAESSRSHSVFCLEIESTNPEGSKRSSKLMMVDLAGSEKTRKTNAVGTRLREAKMINQSLSQLGRVIRALTESASHIPYRDSKLTRLLQDSLGGNCKACMICCVSPSSYNCEESVTSLRFGTMCKKVKNKPKVNQELSVKEYQAIVKQLEMKIEMWSSKNQSLEQMLQTLHRQLQDNNIAPEIDPPPPSDGTTGPSQGRSSKTGGGLMGSSGMSSPQQSFGTANGPPQGGWGMNSPSNEQDESLYRRWQEAETQNKILVQENLDLMDQMADVRNELVAQKAHAYDLQETITEKGQDVMRLQAMMGNPMQAQDSSWQPSMATPPINEAPATQEHNDEAHLRALRKRNDSLENRLIGMDGYGDAQPSNIPGHRYSIDSISSTGSHKSNTTNVSLPDLMPFSERKQFKGKLDSINEDLKQKNYETYTVTVYETPFGMNLADDRVTSVKGPAATAGVKVGSQIHMVNGQAVGADTWFDAFCQSNIPFVITFRHKVTRTEKYKEILAKCEANNDEQGRRALFFRIIASEKKTRQKLEKAKHEAKQSKQKLLSSDQKFAIKDELVENTRAQLQQMEQLARLSQQMHIEERAAYEKELTDKTDEINKLKGHLRTIMEKLRGGKGKRNPLAGGGHIRRPIGRHNGNVVNASDIKARAQQGNKSATQGKI